MTYGELVAEGRIRPEIEDVVRKVYELVPGDGSRTTEKKIADAMEESERPVVREAVDVLKAGGLVTTGRGRARSVQRVSWSYPNEHSLYAPMRAEIATRWADESPHDYIEPDRFCEVVATHGTKGGGRWSAPDITLIGGKTLPLLPGKFLDVITFEVKPWLDIAGLYEALSHRAHTTHAYLICHVPPGTPDQEKERIAEHANRVGVGFIVARRPEDYGTWEEVVPATRWSPEPEALHEFVAGVPNRNVIRSLRAWLRADPFYGERPPVDFSRLELSPEDETLAEDIYLDIPVNGSVGWKHFQGWIDKADVERIRKRLRDAGIIRVVQKGGMRLPDS